jgi:hypothetical protein
MTTDKEAYERDLRERQRRHLESLQQGGRPWKPCAHDQCTHCYGTGVTAFGPCVHAIYCDCPKCSATSTVTGAFR